MYISRRPRFSGLPRKLERKEREEINIALKKEEEKGASAAERKKGERAVWDSASKAAALFQILPLLREIGGGIFKNEARRKRIVLFFSTP